MSLVKDTHPELRQEWHPSRNEGVSFDELRTKTKTKVWWLCKKNPKHEWQADVRRRAIDKNGCPYCSHLKVLREESFAALFPTIAADWHPTRNGSLDPWTLGPQSNKRIWWQCRKNPKHVWNGSIHTRVRYMSGCRQCNRTRNPFSKAYPEIAREWHPTKNDGRTADDISAGSREVVWWRCAKVPAHEWQARIDGRIRAKSGCPFCVKAAGNIPQPTLDVFSRKLAGQWHPTKNSGLKPSDVSVGSTRQVWWLCPVNPEHAWKAAIRNRAKLHTGCPYCARRSKFAGPGKSLAERFPKIAAQWHSAKNGELKPASVTPGSAQRVWWQCLKDPSHEWQATVMSRTSKRSKALCPFCSGFRVTTANSLATQHPDIAKQWHPSKNGALTAEKVKRASGRKVWWQCPTNPAHEWQSQIKNRTVLGSGCPLCEADNRVRRLQDVLAESAGSNTNFLQTFTSSMRALRALAKREFPEYLHLKQPFYRMLYSSAITVMETYLSDAFYQTVIKDDVLIEHLILTTPDFAERKYTLTEVVGWHKATKQKVTEYLFDIVWHNLAKVRAMYETVLGVKFPTDAAAVHRAVAIRHDLVHRNGRTKAGSLHRFSLSEIEALFAAIELFVQSIDAQLKSRPATPAAGSSSPLPNPAAQPSPP
ncbi:MAG: hypothetical protein FJ395_11190 [Verrucomicrobia bacterium]|nr:hypothetical protein [Verrucomicrobiota bacterium]